MFSSSIRNLPYVQTWEGANNTFNNTKQPVTRKNQWRDNQRPLKDSRSHHYRIEKGDGYYDVCLYSTVMARYYEPTPQGRRVLYTGHPSNMSKQFMRNVVGTRHLMQKLTTDGRAVSVPVANRDFTTDKGTGFSADLWLVDNRIDVSKSSHTPHYVKRSTAEDKAKIAGARQNCESLITLACLRMPEFVTRVIIDDNHLVPFQGVAISYAQGAALNRVALGQRDVTQEDINCFMLVAELVYDYEATKICAKYPNQDTLGHVTEKILADGLWRVIKRSCGFLNHKSGAVPLAQFMDSKDYPHTTATPYG